MTPNIDVVITTIGRRSLYTALLASLSQTYPGTRTVVCADGYTPEAREIFNRLIHAYPTTNAIYVETPTRYGHGSFVKEWWINNPEAAQWVRLLDDDDWMPPYAISEMVKAIDENTSVVVCKNTMCVDRGHSVGRVFGVRGGTFTKIGVSTATCLLKTASIKGEYPLEMPADYHLAKRALNSGEVKFVQLPLYWANGYRGGKGHARKLDGGGYKDRWEYTAPHTFRRSLISKVPLINFYDRDGALYKQTEDQAMFRPMAKMAKKVVRIAQQYYVWDKVRSNGQNRSCQLSKKHITTKGFRQGNLYLPNMPVDYNIPEACILVPCYKAHDKIQRCLKSIRDQKGDWRCIVAVDGNDQVTAQVARDYIGKDARFSVTVQPTRLYGLGNQLSVIEYLPGNTIICQVDGDDYLEGNNYIEAVYEMYQDPDVELTHGAR